MPTESPSAPVVELLDWISLCERSYSEALDAWNTQCQRLSVWEDALTDGLVEVRRNGAGSGSLVALTRVGASALRSAGT